MNPIITKERIEYIKNSGLFDEVIDEIKSYAEEEIGKDNPELKFSDFNKYIVTGNREDYEAPYFEKRYRLNAFMLMYLLYGEEKYRTAVENSIWSICDEYTWSLPAHIQYDKPIEVHFQWIDLFASETGATIAEILSLIENDLDKSVVWRAKHEIRRRIIDPYIKHDYTHWWESSTNNWSAVCACGVGASLFYEAKPEEVEESLPRLLKTIDYFLSGFGNDGCCMEGSNYWDYGFGMFVNFADLLKNYTDGRIDLFENEKVHNIAKFRQKAFIGKSKNITFSDAGRNAIAMPGLSNYLHNIYDDAVMMPKNLLESCFHKKTPIWIRCIRNLAWFNPEELPEVLEKEEYIFFEDAQWYIRNKEKYSIAAKGGHNNEPHNHNDLGSFVMLIGDERVLDDYGSGRYTRQYFSDERYTILVNASRGHSVPIVNGNYQIEGAEHKAEVVSCGRDCFELDISKAYDDDTVNSIIRRFDITDNGMILTDSYSFSKEPKSVTERFFTCIKPEIKADCVIIGECKITADMDRFNVTVTEEEFAPHAYGSANETAYLIDFDVKEPNAKEKTVIEFSVI